MRNLGFVMAILACASVASAAMQPLWNEVEPNDTIATAIANNFIGSAVPPGAGSSIEGYLNSGNVDWYAFSVSDSAYIGAAGFDNGGVGADAQFQLINAAGTIIEWDDDDGVGLMPSLEATVPAGTYLLGVSAYADVTSTTGLTQLLDGVDNLTGGPTEANFTYKVSIVTNVVPEPTSLVLLVLGTLIRRR